MQPVWVLCHPWNLIENEKINNYPLNVGEIPKATEPAQQDDLTTISPPSNVSSITQEDLDKLKADIENLEAEDLGGLSNDWT